MIIQFAFPMPPGCGNCCPQLFCHDLYGDTLPVTTSGITVCSGCFTAFGNDYSFTLTGINSAFNTTWSVGNLDWEGANGVLTVHKYSSSDGSCVGEIGDVPLDVVWVVTCVGENSFTVTHQTLSAFGFSFSVFSQVAPGGPSEPIDNANAVGGCGVPGAAAYDGTFTVDV